MLDPRQGGGGGLGCPRRIPRPAGVPRHQCQADAPIAHWEKAQQEARGSVPRIDGERMVSLMSSVSTRFTASGAALALLLTTTLLYGCSFFGGSRQDALDISSPSEEAATPEPSPSPRVIAVATPRVWPTPFGTPSRAMATRGPTMEGTPTAPAATPTSAPLRELPELTRSLDDKIVALVGALSSRDVDRSLRLQKELLAEADRVENALQVDESAQADLVRQALRDIRAGAAGDPNKLESARAKLRVASGAPPPVDGVPSASPQAMASSLQTKLRSFSQARKEQRVDELLRLQQELLLEASQAEKGLANQNSESADRLRSALQDLKSGLAGEESKLESAMAGLQIVAGSSGQPGSQPDSSRRLLAAAAALDNKLAILQEALAGGGRDELLRAQRELIEEIAKAEEVARDGGSQEAQRLQDALSLARDGASGDPAKLSGARTRLNDLLGSQAGAPGQADGASRVVQPTDLSTMADDLSRKVDAYKAALEKGDRDAMLRLQSEMLEQVAKDEQALQGNPARQADQYRSALSDLRNALRGDYNKLNSANATLRLVANAAEPSRPQPAPDEQRSQEVQSAARDLTRTIDHVEEAVRSGDADDLERAKKELEKASEALQKLPPAEAAALRSALTAANEALAGDQSKLEQARNRLKEIIPR